MVTTTILINNPSEDGTCHNLDIGMIEVGNTSLSIYQNYLVSDRESYKTPLGMVLKLSLLKPTGSVTVGHATLTRV